MGTTVESIVFEGDFADMVKASRGVGEKCSVKSRFVKRSDSIPNLDLGFTVAKQNSIHLKEKSLIGKFTGHWPNPKTVQEWVSKNWVVSNLFFVLLWEWILCVFIWKYRR
jgi:hypothetical protein